MIELQRLTTEYDEAEDRLRLAGQGPDGQTVVLWLTQRLLGRLVPPLCQWLEGQGAAGFPVDVVQAFAQESALAALEPQAPVRAGEGAQEWLVQSVDLKLAPQALSLQFKPAPQAPVGAVLGFSAEQLRQWLGIVHGQSRHAGWSEAAWPDWLTEARRLQGVAMTGAVH